MPVAAEPGSSPEPTSRSESKSPAESSPRPRLSRTVIGLGWVSLLTDASSDIIFPLLPVFLTEVLGAPATFLGVIEGLADGTSSLVKYFSGGLADRLKRSKPLVLTGYTISSLVKPLVALAGAPWHVLAVRIADRMGKGIRSSPRDAMLAAAADPSDRGRSFGFHQAMDHAGTALGTLLGAGLLWLALDLRTVFALAAIPGLLSVLVLALVPEPSDSATGASSSKEPTSTPANESVSMPSALWRYLAVLFVFTLANSSDAFLILKVREVSGSGAKSTVLAPLLWLVLHTMKALLGTFGGALSDKLSRLKMLAAGWACYGVSYAAMGEVKTVPGVFLVASCYALYSALAEGAERAQVADLAPSGARGRAFGWYNLVNGIGLLGAGVLFGQLWDHSGSRTAFRTAGALALIAALLLLLVRPPARR
jgi:MFS family permease